MHIFIILPNPDRSAAVYKGARQPITRRLLQRTEYNGAAAAAAAKRWRSADATASYAIPVRKQELANISMQK